MRHRWPLRARANTKLPIRFILAGCVGFGGAIWSSAAHGQEAARSDELLRRQEQQVEELRRRQEASPDVRLQAAPVPSEDWLPVEEVPCRAVSEVRVQGDGKLAAVANAALGGLNGRDAPGGRCLGEKAIALLLKRANNAVISSGYITSRIDALPQSLADGLLTLQAVPGRIENIKVLVDAASRPANVSVLPLREGHLLNLRDVEQMLESLRRTSDANVSIAPGSKDGYSNLVVAYQPPQAFGLTLSLDDSGSEATGRWQSAATLAWNSPLGLSDLFYVSASKNMPVGEKPQHSSASQTIHYSVPIGYWLASATASSSESKQTLPGGFGNLYSGSSRVGEFEVQRVVSRDALSKISLGGKAFWRSSGSQINDEELVSSRRKTGGWEVSGAHVQYIGDASLNAQLSYRRGTGAFGAQPAPEELADEGSSRMRIVQSSIGLWMPLSLGSAHATYTAQLRLQWNANRLTAQDRMCIGGRYSVRGFDGEQSLCANRGQVLRNELTQTFPGIPALRPYVAVDVGRVQGRSAPDDAWLAGAVVGLRWSERSFFGGVVQFDAFLGRPLRKPDGFQTARTAAGLSLSASF